MQLHPHDQIDVEYLHQDHIGGVISEGLTVLYREQPRKPVEFLAKWLLQYSKEQNNKVAFEEIQENKLQLHQKHKDQLLIERLRRDDQERTQKQKLDAEEAFRKRIQDHDYPLELLQTEFCQYLKDKSQLTGVYVCHMDFQKQQVDLESDDDWGSHINKKAPKLLHYIAASKDHQYLVGKQLHPEQGITYNALKLTEEQEADNIYVPDVVKDKRILFHNWPKLGAYLVVPVSYHTCLTESAFDAGLEHRLKYLHEKAEQEKQYIHKVEELEAQIEHKAQAGENTSELEEELEQYKESIEEIVEPPFQTTKEDLVFCFDTLGQDREIPQKDRQYLIEYVRFFGQSWTNREATALSDSIDQQIEYLDSLPHEGTEVLLEQFQREEDAYVEERLQENFEYYQELKEKEKQYTYELDCMRLDKLKEKLSDDEFIAPLLSLSKRRVIKFPGILQNALYLLNHHKEDINIPGTNELNWRFVRELLNKQLIMNLVNYQHKGPRSQQPYPWSMVDRIERNLAQFDQESVDQYNFAYGRLFLLLLTYCRLRKTDIELRREKIANTRKQIADLKEEIDNLKSDQEQVLQDHIAGLSEEEREVFNEAEWVEQYYAEHTLPEVPDEPEDEVDADYQFDE